MNLRTLVIRAFAVILPSAFFVVSSGCVARIHSGSDTTTAASSSSTTAGSSTTYGSSTTNGSSTNSSSTTSPESETTYPSTGGSNTTNPQIVPSSSTTVPSASFKPRTLGDRPVSVSSLEMRQKVLANVGEDESKKADPRDWYFWRGPEQNGISRETGLVDEFDPEGGEGSNLSWKRSDLGGRSTPITLNGRLYTLVRDNPGEKEEGEKVVCVDLKTGKTLWENTFNVWLSDVPDTRVGWSSAIADPETGNVYALGVCDYFQCIDGKTGETIWSLPLHERFGFLSTYGGRTNFPVICDDLVIISAVVIGWGEMAKPAQRFVAFDKQTGEVVWMNGTRPLPYDTTYSTPTVTVIDGQKAMIFGSSDGDIWALQPRTGEHIWKYPFSRRGLNVSPLVVGDKVYSSHSEENIKGALMGAVVAIDGAAGTGDITEKGELWKIEEVMAGKSSPLVIDDRLYVFDDRAKVHVFDRNTGERITRDRGVPIGTVMRASPVYAEGKIYAVTAGGRYYVLEPDERRGISILERGRFPTSEEFPAGEECYASPIISHGKLFVQTTGGLYCFEDASKEHGITPQPKQPEEAPVADDPAPAHVQVVPAEVLTKPGAEHTFRARLFNARGQFLKEVPAAFEVEGPGAIDEHGNFTADGEHVAAHVVAKVGDLEGRARLRVVPDLPWHFDFTGMEDLPVTWVGARYRHQIREMDGNNVVVKVTTIPKGTRSRCWFGHPGLSNYTIQADVRGALTEGKMPDIGLIAQGYAIDLQGANQKLQIRRWVTQLHMAETIDFPWKPNVWYTMKLKTSLEGDKAVLRGKVWPRGETEPDEWTITASDPRPNKSGSPGLYGNAKDAELYLDNISVTPN